MISNNSTYQIRIAEFMLKSRNGQDAEESRNSSRNNKSDKQMG
jgi:hypothetical protein